MQNLATFLLQMFSIVTILESRNRERNISGTFFLRTTLAVLVTVNDFKICCGSFSVFSFLLGIYMACWRPLQTTHKKAVIYLINPLPMFKPMFSFFIPWNYQEISSSFMISGGIERNIGLQWVNIFMYSCYK